MYLKQLLFVLLFFTTTFGHSQIAHYNQYPTKTPLRTVALMEGILDGKTANISVALSMRKLRKKYAGPLVRLRRIVDDKERNFYPKDAALVIDKNKITQWAAGSELRIVIWYDQSGLERNAVQYTPIKQPLFKFKGSQAYWKGDGIDDHLEIASSIQQMTNNGKNGTVICVLYATSKSQHTFGVLVDHNRWSTHINWSDQNLYFDPGQCCNNNIRSTNNSNNTNHWSQYTLIRTDSNVIIRVKATEKLNDSHTFGPCTLNLNFTLGWANGNQAYNHSTTSFSEFIMYKTGIDTTTYKAIEDNQINYWQL
ncbi:MAG: hypothetical protein COB98_08935 [Flavobacteriaceae bacterium]|nr:MAG: hypothetical protein COB98_08935 [Flavobacteriaceae bacterium]